MRSTLVFAAALGLAPAVSLAAPASATRTWRDAAGNVEVVAGVLSAPSRATPSRIARAYLAGAPLAVDPAALREQVVRPAGQGGAIVQLRQTHAGLDVVGAAVAVRVDAQGQVRWMASTARALPDDLDVTATIDADAAIAAAFRGPGRRQSARTLDPARHARLVVWAPAGQEARPAWKVVLPRDLRLLETLLVYVDARTGRVLHSENLVKLDRQAWVFEQNPVATPTPVQVTLPLPASPTQLDGPDILGRNCVDNHTCQPFDIGGTTVNVHMCEFLPTALADASSDFLYTRPATDLEPEDEFAEVQMYWHATLVYEYFRGFGFTNLATRPMSVVANFRMPPLDQTAICLGSTNDGPLNPLDNAAYIPQGGLTGTFPADDMLVFGQGTGADLAYEGDVVYHEMGHAVAGTVNAIGVALPDAYGIDPTPGGMSEGYADYFAGAFTNDSKIGEYSGPSFGLAGPIRDMDNADTCPRSLTGEVHYDSLPWTGALWEIRTALAEGDRATFDRAVYDVFATITEADSMLAVAARTIAEVDAALGATAAATAEGIFAARGFDDCDNRVIDTAVVASHPFLNAYGTDQIEAASVPGPVQFQVTLTEPASEITVAIGGWQQAGLGGIGGGGSAPSIQLLVKPGAEPIQWTWGASVTHDAPVTGPVTLPDGGGAGAGAAAGDFAPGTYHVMLANAGASAFLRDISFSSTPAVDPPDAGPGPDAGDPGADGSDSGGCCDTGASGTGTLPLALATLLLALRRRPAPRPRPVP